MTKVRFYGPIAGFSGAMDEMVFADNKKKNKTVAYMKKKYPPSEAQLEHQKHFSEAAAYAQSALSNGQRAFYELKAEKNEKGATAFALAVADYLCEPTVESVYSDGYNGQIGNEIIITASDNYGVVQVKVALSANQGAWVEEGLAVVDSAGSGDWIYTATTEAPAGAEVTINVAATDRPGGKGLHTSQRIL